MEMQAKMWQKDEKLRQLKEIVQVCLSQACYKTLDLQKKS